MRQGHFTSILLAAFAWAALAGPVSAHDGDEERGGHERRRTIVFTSNRTGNNEIFSMDEDGSHAVNLTNNPASPDTFPAASPDGRQIVFTRGRGFGRELFLMNVDGSGQRPLTANAAADFAASWSPDGSRIAFVRFATDFTFSIWILDPSGVAPERLLVGGPEFKVFPAWSPNGRWIAYSSDGEGFSAIYKVRADGRGTPRRLTPPERQAGGASWSPDGDSIVFSDNICPTCDQSDIWIMDLEDGALQRVTDTPDDNELFPSWSADGRRIVCESSPILNGALGLPDVVVVDPHRGTSTNLTDSPDVLDGFPRFVPSKRHEPHDDDSDDERRDR
jgi:Tol biopolymer transport system component